MIELLIGELQDRFMRAIILDQLDDPKSQVSICLICKTQRRKKMLHSTRHIPFLIQLVPHQPLKIAHLLPKLPRVDRPNNRTQPPRIPIRATFVAWSAIVLMDVLRLGSLTSLINKSMNGISHKEVWWQDYNKCCSHVWRMGSRLKEWFDISHNRGSNSMIARQGQSNKSS